MSKTTNSIVKPTFVPSQDDPCPCSLLVESRRTWSNPDMSFHVKDKICASGYIDNFLGLDNKGIQYQER